MKQGVQGCAWLCKAVFGCARLCMAVFEWSRPYGCGLAFAIVHWGSANYTVLELPLFLCWVIVEDLWGIYSKHNSSLTALHILFIWQVVHITLNRKLRVHFGCLGRFFWDFGLKTHPFTPRYALHLLLLFGSWPTTSGKGHLALAVFRCFSCSRTF